MPAYRLLLGELCTDDRGRVPGNNADLYNSPTKNGFLHMQAISYAPLWGPPSVAQ